MTRFTLWRCSLPVYLSWLILGLAGIVAAAFVFWGLLGANWAVRNLIWASAQVMRVILFCLGSITGLATQGCQGAVSWLAKLKRPKFQAPRVELTPTVATVRILGVILVAIAAWYAWSNYGHFLSFVSTTNEAVTVTGPIPAITRSETLDTSALAGQNFGDLFAAYTGIHGRVGSSESIDFCRNLRLLWDRKVERSGGNMVVRQVSTQIVAKYCLATPTSMTLANYRVLVERVIGEARNNLNWAQVAQIESLDYRRLSVLRNIVGALDGDDFVAYALTELMPGSNGKLNVSVLDFLLRNAGREYVESIPALYDPYTSFGPYQFTQYAWYETGREKRGGSRINRALATPIAHGSVMNLKGDEHHTAAFLFAVHNLGYTIRWLNLNQVVVLENNWRRSHDDIVQFIATAHHAPYGPRGAQGAFTRWLTNRARTDYSVSLTGRLVQYGLKTRANLAAVKAS